MDPNEALMTEFKTDSGCVQLIQNMITMFLDECHSSDESSDQSQTTDDNSEIGSLEDKDVETSEFLKSWVVESLPTVSNHLKLDQDAKFRVQKEVLKFLAVQGLNYKKNLGGQNHRFPVLCARCVLSSYSCCLLMFRKERGHMLNQMVLKQLILDLILCDLSVLSNIPSVSLSKTLNTDDEKAFKKLQAIESQLSREI